MKPGGPGSPPVGLGDLKQTEVRLALGCLAAMIVLHLYRVRIGILLSIVATTVAGVSLGVVKMPDATASWPDLSPIFWKLDIAGALETSFLPIILTIFVLDFVDGIGTLLGLSDRAGLLDENGRLPEIEKPLLVDSLSTVGASLLGTTTSGPFIESATGIEAGGRTGLTSVVTALCFLPALFFAEYVTCVPAFAYGPALVLVGIFMFASVSGINFSDDTESIPAVATIGLMIFTYNIGQGITVGLLLYPTLKLLRGRVREVSGGLWVLAALSAAYYVTLAF
ncbi:MAG: NCS2 family permease [Planctomycetota bacterium]